MQDYKSLSPNLSGFLAFSIFCLWQKASCVPFIGDVVHSQRVVQVPFMLLEQIGSPASLFKRHESNRVPCLHSSKLKGVDPCLTIFACS
jgi:hypothetical protein